MFYVGVGMYLPTKFQYKSPGSRCAPVVHVDRPRASIPLRQLVRKRIWPCRNVSPSCVASRSVALPLAAQAQHKSPLADAPAIRKRVELR